MCEYYWGLLNCRIADSNITCTLQYYWQYYYLHPPVLSAVLAPYSIIDSTLHFSSASGQLLGRPAICQWLTSSLYRAFNSFARSFHPGTLNFEGFVIPNICLPLVSIAFDININKSLSLFASVPLFTRSSPPGAASSIVSNPYWPAAVHQVPHLV